MEIYLLKKFRMALFCTFAYLIMAMAEMHAQNMMPLPAHASNYSIYARGYWFEAPMNFVITGLRVSPEAGTGPQYIHVVKVNVPMPIAFTAQTTNFTTLTYISNATNNVIQPVNIYVSQGDIIGILGTANDTNSYSASAIHTTNIGPHNIKISRFGHQGKINTAQAPSVWGVDSTTSGQIARVEMYWDYPCPPVPVLSAPVVPSVVQCTEGQVQLIASSTHSQVDFYWYDSLTGGNPVHIGDTLITSSIAKGDSIVYYVEVIDSTNCPSERTQVVAKVLGNPPTSVGPGTVFHGQFNYGGLSNIDLACAGDTLVYEVLPPAGYSNADFGTQWIISNLSFQTANGTAPADTSAMLPSPFSNASLTFVPALNEGDSTFFLNVTILDMNNGCDTSIQRFINIAPLPEPGFSSPAACLGMDMQFINTTIMQGSGSIDYAWNFGDNSPLVTGIENPLHLYSSPDTYNVVLTTTSNQGCISSASLPVTVLDNPEALFTVEGHCANDSVAFINQSVVHPGSSSYEWQFGTGNDTSTASNPTYYFGAQGSYSVRLVVENNGCSDTSIQLVNIQSAPDASFETSGFCEKYVTEFTNTTTAAPGAMTYEWTIDGNTFNTEHAQYLFQDEGNYSVSLLATHANQCSGFYSEEVEILPTPDAGFSYYQTNFYWIEFTANQSGHVRYSWDFGDGNTGTGEIVSHMYSYDSNFVATLIVEGASGCTDTFSQIVLVYVNNIDNKRSLLKDNSLKIFPNPYTDFASITFELLSESQVRLEVYNMNGKLVERLQDGKLTPGKHSHRFNAHGPGIYLIRLEMNGNEHVQKMIELR